MSKKIWKLMYVAGNPAIFKKIHCADNSPMTRAEAVDGFNTVAALGWRVWVEHAETGKRIAESEVEKTWNIKN